MFMLNESYWGKSFNVLGEGAVATSFRQALARFEDGLMEENHASLTAALTPVAPEIH
jgi:hypothetical protein